MSCSRLGCVAPLTTLLCSLFASSGLAGELIRVDLVPKAQQGQGSPELVVHAEADLAQLSLSVVRSIDGRRIQLQSGRVAAAGQHRFALSLVAPAQSRFSGRLVVRTPDGQSSEMPIDVEVELLRPLELRISKEDVDLAKRRLRLVADRPLKKVQISVMSDMGVPLGTTEVAVDGLEAEVTWEQREGTPLKISVQAWDADQFFGGTDLFPWQIDIPHEEVNFETGSADIPPKEVPKLEASFQKLKEAIAKYGKLATVNLFIAGHTDTVGDAASNHSLSERRARSLGQWFKRRGVGIGLSTAGFGEERLLVRTPDETDEARNRRAEYIVAVDPPPMKGARWEPLR